MSEDTVTALVRRMAAAEAEIAELKASSQCAELKVGEAGSVTFAPLTYTLNESERLSAITEMASATNREAAEAFQQYLEADQEPILACPPDQLTADDLGDIMQPEVGMFLDIKTGEIVKFGADGRAYLSMGSPPPSLVSRLVRISKRKVKDAEDAARAQDERAKAAVELGVTLQRVLKLDAGDDAQLTGEAVLDVMAPRVEAAVRAALDRIFPDFPTEDDYNVSESTKEGITEDAITALRGETLGLY